MGIGLLALACSPNTGSLGSGSGGTPVGDDTTSDATDGGSGTGSSGVADGSGTGTGNDSDPTATTMPPDGTDDGPVETTGGEESSSGDPPPMPMQQVLERANLAACSVPLWCVYSSSNPFNPWPNQQMWFQECFDATLPAPFLLRQLDFVVGGMAGTPNDVWVQVYQRSGSSGRGALLGERALGFTPAMGMNTVMLDPPLVIDQQQICIGLASLSVGSALGIAVDEGSSTDDTSYFRLEGDCTYGWNDVYNISSNPDGDWCIRGLIEEQL